MLRILFSLMSACLFLLSAIGQKDIKKWEKQASNITIIRDKWGIPHIYGKTDADAVFGLLYAQCEDDFNRVEMNYLEKLGVTLGHRKKMLKALAQQLRRGTPDA